MNRAAENKSDEPPATAPEGPTDDATAVRIEHLTKTFGVVAGRPAVDDVSLDIHPGELLVLLGPSGCGKTTLLRCVAGLERPTAGRLVLGGRVVYDGEGGVEVPPHRRDLGLVFQNYALWPHMSVGDNVAYPLRWRGVGRRDRRTRALEALELVECAGLADRLPAALSGGQQQRVALARAIVARPRLMLFDEPLSNLDFLLRNQVRDELRRLHRSIGFTGIYVTHDQLEALYLGTRVAVIRDGHVEQIGDPQAVFANPATPYVAGFLGVENQLRAVRRDGRWTIAEVPGATVRIDGFAGSTGVRLFFRSGDVRLDEHPPSTPHALAFPRGVVDDVVYAGSTTEIVVNVDGLSLQVRTASQSQRWQIGASVHASVAPDAVLAYHAEP